MCSGSLPYLNVFCRNSFLSLLTLLFLLVNTPSSHGDDFTAKNIGDYGNVTVMEASGNYDARTPDGQVNAIPRQAIAKEFYKTHKDEYDFFVIFTNFDFRMPESEVQGFYQGVKNDTKGIGSEIFDNTPLYGSNGKLQGTIDMGSIDSKASDPLDPKFEETLDVLAHEMLHRWCARVRFNDASGNASTALLGKGGSHWSFLLDTKGSLEYGNQWRDNGNGTFTSIAAWKYYSPLDLYLMGMIDRSKVPPMLLIDNPAVDPAKLPELGATISGTPRTVTIDDIIAAEGERVPAVADSQKQFKMAFIFVTAPGSFTGKELPGIESIRNGFLTRYSILTDGKGLVQVASTLKEELPVNPGTKPVQVVPRTLPPDIRDGVKWLTENQQPDGSWSDLSMTSERDTAEAVAALKEYPTAAPQFQAGLQWLSASSSANTDYLARRLESIVHAGGDASADVSELAALQNPDGGWGSGRSFISDPADTALALVALLRAGYADRAVIGRGVDFLKAHQNGDGGWSDSGPYSAVQPTAAAVSAFVTLKNDYNLSTQADKGVAWLLTRQKSDGGFGNSPSTVYDTALAVMALREVGADMTVTDRGVDYIHSQQSENGSWFDSPFQTALAVGAVWQATVNPDLSITNSDISFIPEKITSLPTTAVINAVISNLGRTEVPQAKVVIYDGTVAPDNMIDEQYVAFPALSPLTVTFSVPVNDGNSHTFHIVVDPDNQVKESNETNNSAVKALLPEVSYDFQVLPGDISISDNPAEIYRDVKISAKVTNRGTSDAYNAQVRYFIDEAGSPFEIATVTVDIPAGATITREITWKASKVGADMPLTVQVDPFNTFTEISESNNRASVPITVNGANLANLAISYKDIVVAPNPAREQGTANISILVKNNGFASAENVKVDFYKGVPGKGGELIGSQVIPALAAGQSERVAVNWGTIADSGERIIYVVADPESVIQEITRDDNEAFTTIDILSLPDLAISTNSVVLEPNAPKEGESLALVVTVLNNGDQDAVNVPVEVKENGSVIGNRVIPLVAGKGQATASIPYPTAGRTGSHEVEVSIDPDNTIIERGKDNNRAVKTFSIQDANLWLSEPYFSPNGDGVKDTTDFFFRLAAPAKVTVLAVNRKGETVRTFAGGGLDNTSGTTVTWDGMGDGGMVVADGEYQLKVVNGSGTVLGSLTVVVDNNRSTLDEAFGTDYFYKKEIGCNSGYDGGEWQWLNDESGFVVNSASTDNIPTAKILISSLDGEQEKIIEQSVGGYSSYGLSGRSPNSDIFSFISGYSWIFQWKLPYVFKLANRDNVLASINLGVDSTCYDSTGSIQQKWSYKEPALAISIYAKPSGSNSCAIRLDLVDWSSMPASSKTLGYITVYNWSPDGSRLAYVVGGTQVRITDSHGNTPVNVYTSTHGNITTLQWIDDESLMLASYGYGTFIFDITNHTEKRISEYASPSLAPDKSKFLIQTEGGADVLTMDGTLITRYDSLATSMYFPNEWSPDSRNVAIQLYNYQDYPLNILDTSNHNLVTLPCETQYPFTPVHWYNNEVLVYATAKQGVKAYNVTNDKTIRLHIFDPLDYYQSQDLNHSLSVSPYGNYLSWNDPDNYDCFADSYYISFSMMNLLSNMNIMPQRESIIIKGTAVDLNFAGWKLEYADKNSPDIWNPIAPPSEMPVIDGEFATWIPPAEGVYDIRLTVWDKAGNIAVKMKRVPWHTTSSIGNIYKSCEIFSPNGDGVKDSVELHYQILDTIHLEFTILDDNGIIIRTFHKEHAEPGLDYISWDGKDDWGRVVADGKYTIRVLNFDFNVEVDNTIPDIGISLGSLEKKIIEETYYGVKLSGQAFDKNLKQWAVLLGEGENPSNWTTYLTGNSPLVAQNAKGVRTDALIKDIILRYVNLGDKFSIFSSPFEMFVDKRIRIDAEDFAGNKRSFMTTDQLEEKIIMLLWDGGNVSFSSYLPETFVSQGSHYIEAVETIRNPLTKLDLQYKIFGDDKWHEIPAESPASNGIIAFNWNISNVGEKIKFVRIRALDDGGKEYYSETFSIEGRISVRCGGDVRNYFANLNKVDFQLISKDDDRYKNWVSVAVWDSAKGDLIPEGEFVFPILPGQIIEGKDYTIRVIGRDATGGLYISNDESLICKESSSLDLQLSIKFPETECGALQDKADIYIFKIGYMQDITGTHKTYSALSNRDIPGLPVSLDYYLESPEGDQLVRHFDLTKEEISRFTLDTASLQEGEHIVKSLLKYLDISSGDEEKIEHKTTLFVDRVPPAAKITYPAENSPTFCPVQITSPEGPWFAIQTEGIAQDNKRVAKYELFYGTGENPESWQKAMTRVSAVPGMVDSVQISGEQSLQGTIGNWDISKLNDKERYKLKLKVTDVAGNVSCSTSAPFSFDGAIEIPFLSLDKVLFSPNGDGTLDISNATYQIDEYAQVDVNAYKLIQSPNASSILDVNPIRSIISGQSHLFGTENVTWDGRGDSGATVPDGSYGIAVFAKDACGNTSRRWVPINVDNTPPFVGIAYPLPGDALPRGNIIEVKGSADDANLKAFTLEVGQGADPDNWREIASGGKTLNTILGRWNTFGMDGMWTLRLSALDNAGNSSSVTSTIDLGQRKTLIKELTTVPTLFSPNNDNRIDYTSISYELTDTCSVTLKLINDSGISIRSYPNNSLSPGTHTIVWDGRSEAGSFVPDGSYTVELTALSSADPSINQTETITLTVDTTPPLIDIKKPGADSFVNVNEMLVNGTITDPNISNYSMRVSCPDGASPLSEGAENRESFIFGTISELKEDLYTISVEAKDKGENRSVLTRNFIVDRTPPKVTLDTPKEGEYYGNTKNIIDMTGAMVEKNLVRYSLRYGNGPAPTEWQEIIGGETVPISARLYSWKVGKDDGITDGIYTVSLYAEDKVGQKAEAKATVTIDNTLPEVMVTSPKEGDYVKGPFDIKGTLADANLDKGLVEISEGKCPDAFKWTTVKTVKTPVQNGVIHSFQLLPVDGDYCLRLSASDRVGNRSETKVSVTIDSKPPAAPQLSGKIENRTDVRLDWTKNSEADYAGYNIYRDGVKLNSALVDAITYKDTTLREGVYSYTVKAVDRAGNESPSSNPAKLTVDVTGPSVSIASPMDGSRVGSLIDIKGTAYSTDDFMQYRVSIGKGASPTSWSIIRTSPAPISYGTLVTWDTIALTDGDVYAIKLEAEDLSGNVSTCQVAVAIDNSPPTDPVLLTAVPNGANVSLTWRKNDEADLAGYLLYRNDKLANVTGNVIGNLKPYLLTGLSYSNTNLPDGSYTYYLFAMDQAGNNSGQSNTLTVELDNRRPHAVITEPAGGTKLETRTSIKAESPDNDIVSVQFQFKKTQESSWTNFGGPMNGSPYTTYFDPKVLGLTYGDYQLMALATDKVGSDPSPTAITVTYTDLTPPAAPTDLITHTEGRNVTLTWSANSDDLDGYNIYRTTDSYKTKVNSSLLKGAATYIDSNISDGDYDYNITAVDIYGNESMPSDTAAARIYAPAISQPYTPTDEYALGIEGHGAAVNSTVQLFLENVNGRSSMATINADAQGTFALEGINLALGENRISATATDTDGNISRETAPIVIVYNDTPSAPTNMGVVVSGYEAALSWDATNTDQEVIGYNIYRDGLVLNQSGVVSNGTASGLSGWSDNPSYAVDGKLSTYWSCYARSSNNCWWEYDLPQPELINRLDIHWGTTQINGSDIVYGGSNFEIQAWSGYAWIPLSKVTGNLKKDNGFDFKPSYRTDRIRVYISSPITNYVRITEAGLNKDNLVSLNSYLDTDLKDKIYRYKTTAVDKYGFESVPCEDKIAEVGDVIPPTAPKNITASVTGSDVLLDWSFTPNTEADMAGYFIYRQNGQEWVHIGEVTSSTTSYMDTALPNGDYSYHITARDLAGNESEPSNDTSIAIAVEPPPVPSGVIITAPPDGKTLVMVWQASGGTAQSYNVYRSTIKGGPYQRVNSTPIHELSYGDEGLLNGTRYYYVVTSLDAQGNEGGYSIEVSGVPLDISAPNRPMIFAPTLSGIPIIVYEDNIAIAGSAEPGSRVEILRDEDLLGAASTLSEDTHVTAAMNIVGSGMAVSPDGALLAFTDNYGVLRIKDLSRGSIAVVAVSGRDAVWSPDSKRIAYTANDEDYNRRIFIYNLESADITSLTDDVSVNESLPSWSGDGGRLVFRSNRGGTYDIWLKNFVDDSLVMIKSNITASKISISPDASLVAYFYSSNLYIINSNNGTVSQLDSKTDQSSIAWSPDSSKVAFISYRDGNYDMFVTNLSEMATSKLLNYPGSYFSKLAWSPDGTRIAYSKDESYGSSLRAIGLDGEQETLADNLGSINPLRWAQSGEITFIEGNSAHLLKLKGTFTVPNVKLVAGENQIHAVARDDSGNSSLPSDPIEVVFNTGLLPDLVISGGEITVFPPYPKPGEGVLVQAVVKNLSNNDVDNVTVELHLWDSAGNLTLLKSEVIPHMGAGSETTVSTHMTAGNVPGANTVIVVVDPADSIKELLETNNYATAEFFIAGKEEIIMTTSLTSPQYGSAQNVPVTVELRNTGTPVDGTLEVAVEDEAGVRVALLDSINLALAYGPKRTLSYAWNTGSTYAGSYQIHSTLKGASGVLAENRAPLTITPDISIDLKLVTDKVAYGPNENIAISATALNNGKNYIIPKLGAKLRITDSNGNEVFIDNREITNLFPAAEAALKSVWNTGLTAPGDFLVSAEILLAGKPVATKSATFTVKPVSVVTGTITVEPSVVSIGNNFKVSFATSNIGNSEAGGTVRVSLIDPESQTVLSSLEQPLSLPVNGSGNGEFTFSTEGLSLKSYTIRLQHLTGDVIKSISDSSVTVKDGIPPVVSILSPREGTTYFGSLMNLALVHDDASGIQRVEYLIDNGEWKLMPVSDPSQGKYSIIWEPAATDSGIHSFSCRAWDGAGNLSTPVSVSFVVQLDTTPPVLTVSTLSDGAVTNIETLNIAGTVTDNTAVRELQINGVYVPVNADGSFSHPVLLTDGKNVITTTAYDFAGNRAEDIRTITLDRNAPFLEVTNPTDNLRTGEQLAVVSGTVDEICNVEIRLKDVLLNTITTDSTFTYTVVLQPGLNNIEVTAHDLAGNPSTQKRTVFFDNEKPTLAITSPAHDIRTNMSNITIQGIVSDPQSAVNLTLNIDGTIYTPPVVNGTFEQEMTLVEERLYNVVAIATDGVAGHEVSAQRNIIYDVTKPVLTIDPVMSPTDETFQAVTGTREEGLPVVVTSPTATVGEVTYPTITSWRVELSDLNSGENVITASSSDSAGNMSEVSANIVVRANESDLILIPFPNILWPPNHKLVRVVIAGWITHPCHSDIKWVDISVTDEYGKYNYKDLHFGSVVVLEAWRNGNDKDGRVYTVTAVATHKDGSKTTTTKRVVVPHDMSPKHGWECGLGDWWH